MKRLSVVHRLALCFLVVISLPIVYLLLQVGKASEVHLKSFLLIEYVKNTLLMVGIAGICSAFLGASLAWIVSFYDFPFRKLCKILLALPLAIPPYVAAIGYGDFFYHQGLFSKLLGFIGISYYFDMRNIFGAIFVYVITLYPYVYLICLSYYADMDRSLVDNARLLKANDFTVFFRIAFPLAKVAIISGVMLLAMEIISDFGVVDYYGVQAFSTGIYKVWLNYGDFYGAIRLSAVALLLILVFVVLEQYSRRKRNYSFVSHKQKQHYSSSFKMNLLIYAYIILIAVIALFLPILQLAYNAMYVKDVVWLRNFLSIIRNTVFYCLLVGVLCSVISLLIASFTQQNQGLLKNVVAKFTTMGYSVPGVIIGLAVMFSFIDVDRFLLPFYRWLGITEKVLVLSTSSFVLLFAYVVRFLGISYNTMYAAYKKIPQNILSASRSLKVSPSRAFLRVDLPLLYPSLLISIALVFLEVLKELPITLMLKPYQVETLTSSVYQFTHNEQYGHASLMSLWIVLLGFIVVSIIVLLKEKQHVKNK